jgi:hypothetical protein
VKINRKTKDIEAAGVKFDGWEVLLGGAVVALILAFLYPQVQVLLFWISGGLFVVWVIAVLVVNIARSRRQAPPGEGGGAASAGTSAPKAPTR